MIQMRRTFAARLAALEAAIRPPEEIIIKIVWAGEKAEEEAGDDAMAGKRPVIRLIWDDAMQKRRREYVGVNPDDWPD